MPAPGPPGGGVGPMGGGNKSSAASSAALKEMNRRSVGGISGINFGDVPAGVFGNGGGGGLVAGLDAKTILIAAGVGAGVWFLSKKV